ncbi:MAG: hypothetical protein ACTSRH_02455 [Promethearchaeota archaeon]
MIENNNDQYYKKDKESLFDIKASNSIGGKGLKEKIFERFNLETEIDLTGIVNEPKSNKKIIKYPFDRYIVTIELTPDNKFLGIREIQLNKDFRNYSQKKQSQISFNIEQYYFEE